MPPPSDHLAFRLHLLKGSYVVKQLKPNDSIPSEYLNALTQKGESRFMSLTRTDEEISVVFEANESNVEGNWRCIKIAGPMDFGITGVMCNLSTPLKAAGVPLFAISTWNTDYVLVPRDQAEKAVDALKDDGWHFEHDSLQI